MLRRDDLALQDKGWRELLLSEAAPVAGAAWTDSGERRDRRQLKQRAVGEVRHVPSPPPLTAILWQHVKHFGTAADGRLFRNLTGGDLSESTIARVWDNARQAALTATEYASSLGRRPYDLRHACVSTWLAAGVPSTQVAEWALGCGAPSDLRQGHRGCRGSSPRPDQEGYGLGRTRERIGNEQP